MFDTFKKRVFFKQVKLKVQFIYIDCLFLLTKLYTYEVKLKIEDAVHRQSPSIMHRDIELN